MDNAQHTSPIQPEPQTREFYVNSMDVLDRAEVPYVVGGGYAMAYYTGIIRHTKDLDLFVRLSDRQRALDALAKAGYRTEMTWPPFLVKALHGDAFVDILYNSGNGLCPVDDEWFTNAVSGDVLGRSCPVCPAEEILWTKAFVMDRDRFDGADVAHLILARGRQFDWARLLRRFRGHERALLAHLILFGYIYPSEQDRIPGSLIQQLLNHLGDEPATEDRVCRGTLLAQKQYLTDVRSWGYADARLQPRGPMTPEELKQLPAA